MIVGRFRRYPPKTTHDLEVAWPRGHFCCDVVALQDLKSEVFAWPSGTAPGEGAAGLSPPMPSAAAEVLPGPGRRRLWPFNLCSSVTAQRRTGYCEPFSILPSMMADDSFAELPGQNPCRSAGECWGVVVRELADIAWRDAGDLSDRRGDFSRLPAPVVCVVLQKALDLPGGQDPVQAVREGFGWYVGEGDVSPECGGQRRSDLRVGNGGGTGQRVCRVSFPAAGRGRGSSRGASRAGSGRRRSPG